jgi:uncharacterized protein YdhG (YjbR/CyaY superfamily)
MCVKPREANVFGIRLDQAIKRDIAKTHRVSGATIHFSAEHPLPAALVRKILRARVRENHAAGSRKEKRTTS